jgi:hypothetical protein
MTGPERKAVKIAKRIPYIAPRQLAKRAGEHACEVCGEPFTPKRADGCCCSNACRQDAYRKRKLGAA